MRFSKMHGAGNDFVVIDLRDGAPAPDADLCRLLGDRHRGVGCDQILTISAPHAAGSIASYGIWNSDGSPSGQCGNGARCVAAWLVRDSAAQGDRFAIDSPVGTHAVERLADGGYRIAMGVPDFAPDTVPLAAGTVAADSYRVHVGEEDIAFGAVSMGNPHAVIEVDDVRAANVAGIGPALQSSSMFPNSANIGFAQVLAPDRIRLRVYERGAGETLACGSGACAAAAVLMRRGRIGRDVAVELPGGALRIAWPDDSSAVTMTGPTAFVFEGELDS
ncbi:DapF: diaminopimelate epimerase [Lysobacter silvestris]|uniref:Diaminopimelate epimerase n=2 Tax=Solilutibacter silvestris TaxID=1645665 RepID=A0A2K1Q061_9GAMM|nr:DapF: diaminopimelate epimerase [Lysobacter silvestris]